MTQLSHSDYVKKRNELTQEHTELREYRDHDFDELTKAIDALVLEVIYSVNQTGDDVDNMVAIVNGGKESE